MNPFDPSIDDIKIYNFTFLFKHQIQMNLNSMEVIW